MSTKDFHNVIHIVHLRASLDERLDRLVRSFNGFRKLVHVLWLDYSFEIIFNNFRKLICEE